MVNVARLFLSGYNAPLSCKQLGFMTQFYSHKDYETEVDYNKIGSCHISKGKLRKPLEKKLVFLK